eukprot:2323022-Pyramimonas_sp.AAC.1
MGKRGNTRVKEEDASDGAAAVAELVTAAPRKKKKESASASDAVTCGQCGVHRSSLSTPWPEAPNAQGEVERVGTACLACWDPYKRAFIDEITWTKHCAKIKGDAAYKQKVELAKEVSGNPAAATFDQDEVNIVVEQGYHSLGNYICLKPDALEAMAGGNVTVAGAAISTKSVLAPLTKAKLKSICAAHPDKPAVEVQTFTT